MSMFYILREPTCGCATIAMVDNPDYRKENAKEISKHLAEGMAVERVDETTMREALKATMTCEECVARRNAYQAKKEKRLARRQKRMSEA